MIDQVLAWYAYGSLISVTIAVIATGIVYDTDEFVKEYTAVGCLSVIVTIALLWPLVILFMMGRLIAKIVGPKRAKKL